MAAYKARRLIEKHLGGWGTHAKDSLTSSYRRKPVSRASMDWAPASAGVTSKALTIHSSFEQAYLMLGYPAPTVTHPDQIPLKVLNTILGGGMSSRLFVILREKWGLAYEVSSFYPARLEKSQWVIYLGLPKEKLKTASQKLDELLRNMADQGAYGR